MLWGQFGDNSALNNFGQLRFQRSYPDPLLGYNGAMCLIVFAWQSHPDYPLILAANRDEYYRRPTALADFWEDQPNILGGRDLSGGGTWLSLNRSGRLAAVTNYREASESQAPRSRGELTTNFLNNDLNISTYAQQAMNNGHQYSGFNLLLNEGDQLLYCSNRQAEIQQLPPGVYTLSNHLLNSPWPKAVHTKKAFEQCISEKSVSSDQLAQCLHRRTPFPDEFLPNTGVSLELERMLSPPFIVSKEYGTRCTSIVLKNHQKGTLFVEQTYETDGSPGEQREFSINSDQ